MTTHSREPSFNLTEGNILIFEMCSREICEFLNGEKINQKTFQEEVDCSIDYDTDVRNGLKKRVNKST